MNYGIGSYGLSPLDGVCSSVYIVLNPIDQVVHERYVLRIFEDREFQALAQSFGNGILAHRSAIGWDDLKNIKVALPPISEQTQIACFLDRETSRIDTLIAEQKRLIALLKEKRQAVISHAVTKGLDSSLPMKNSGVEWLGEVPRHWEVGRMKNFTSFITSGSRGWSDFIHEDGKDIFLQSGDLDNCLNVDFDKAKRIHTPEGSEGIRTSIQDGDVVVCITGANTGRVAVIDQPQQQAYVNQHLGLIRPVQSQCYARFLGYSLSSTACQTYFSLEQYGLKEGLSLTDLAEAPVVMPSIAEQVAIVDQINVLLIKFDQLSIDAELTVKLLQERRSALISAAVTGKIDLRNWQLTPVPETHKQL